MISRTSNRTIGQILGRLDSVWTMTVTICVRQIACPSFLLTLQTSLLSPSLSLLSSLSCSLSVSCDMWRMEWPVWFDLWRFPKKMIGAIAKLSQSASHSDQWISCDIYFDPGQKYFVHNPLEAQFHWLTCKDRLWPMDILELPIHLFFKVPHIPLWSEQQHGLKSQSCNHIEIRLHMYRLYRVYKVFISRHALDTHPRTLPLFPKAMSNGKVLSSFLGDLIFNFMGMQAHFDDAFETTTA